MHNGLVRTFVLNILFQSRLEQTLSWAIALLLGWMNFTFADVLKRLPNEMNLMLNLKSIQTF
ncbi:hypothetical protein H6G00_01180 [Leptolyngbya sp. FACHB-541]|uniref:hypothetical protein n=1 Tax=Leptolyngbya sp. FACHB-541 TaxID=2692810 RepID=UPI001686460E|nr:hypothetical protein [Leptolyngbya sp. FACHB-541]MBD1995242.1 hypothetical protein [Leptolyngbya sp. FACHB-541]